MKKYLLILICFGMLHCMAQTKTFDLATFTPPSGWKKEVKPNYVSYTKIDNLKKSWCQIAIYKSFESKGSIEADFESEWLLLAANPYQIKEAPKSGGIQEGEGWKIKVGSGKFTFNNKEVKAILSVISGYNKTISILAITNSQDYLPQIQDLLVSVNLKIPDTIPERNPEQTKPLDSNNIAVVGTWGKSNTVSQINNRLGSYSYVKFQYTFKTNGTYSFTSKNYSEQYDETLLIKENGTYSINGNNLTINPENSLIEAWSKKNGSDNWNQLKSSQSRKLEKSVYQIAIVDGNLVLQTNKETERDGRFSNGSSYSYGPSGTFTAIQLPEIELHKIKM
jgi:hypothetical protein